MSAEYAELDCAVEVGAGGATIGTDGVADLVLVDAAHPAEISMTVNSDIAITCLNNCLI
jgi:hypothetical protein